jgi:hypothetical protein
MINSHIAEGQVDLDDKQSDCRWLLMINSHIAEGQVDLDDKQSDCRGWPLGGS